MPFARPTLTELMARAAADIEAGLPGADARLRRSNLAVIAKMHAAAVNGLFGALDWMARQIIVDTAEAPVLDRHAAIWGVQRLPAAAAVGFVNFRGSISPLVVPVGTELQRGDGARFVTTASVTLIVTLGPFNFVATVPVVAVVAGASGNTADAAVLTLVQPVSGINAAAEVVGGISQGADLETDDGLRARLLARIQQPALGGAAADYVAWALEVPGVTRAWVYPLESGPGTVVVRFVRDNDATLIPDAGEVAAVQAYINLRRPVCAQVTVSAPTAAPLNMTIDVTPDTTAVREAVTAELVDLLRREAQPGGTILLSHLREAISVAAGETNSVLSVPSADVTNATGLISTLGTISWV